MKYCIILVEGYYNNNTIQYNTNNERNQNTYP
jgi:hypothetical protein